MALPNTVLVEKRRVKTGCLPCRRRRRKCDEARPRCDNCRRRDAVCQYPSFSNSSISHYEPHERSIRDAPSSSVAATVGTRSPNEPSSGTPAPFESDDSSTVQTLGPHDEPPPEGILTTATHPNLSAIAHTTPLGLEMDVAPRYTPSSTFNSTRSGYLTHSESIPRSLMGRRNLGSTETSRQEILESERRAHTVRSSSRGAPHLNSTWTPFKGQELQLLCHFRYRTAPWLDSGDPSGFFGVGLVLLAPEHPAIHSAVLAVAARQALLMSSSTGIIDLSGACVHFGQQAETEALVEATEVQYLVSNLVLLEKFLYAHTGDWRNLTHSYTTGSRSMASCNRIAETAFSWFWLRVDLAAAILTSQTPLTDIPAMARARHPSLSAQDRLAPQQTSLLLLAAALSTTYGHDQNGFSGLTQRPSNPHTFSVDDWLNLWSDCQTWYRRRGPELCPVLSYRATEVAQIDASDSAALPTELYSSSRALLPNIAYHMACLLLLTCKPRSAKPMNVDATRQSLSESWHVQIIAGIASNNEFEEQWDPVLVASLSYIGPRLTHWAQRDVVLACLNRASDLTGVALDEDIKRLKDTWALA